MIILAEASGTVKTSRTRNRIVLSGLASVTSAGTLSKRTRKTDTTGRIMSRFGPQITPLALVLTLAALAAGCASIGAVPQPFPRPGGATHPPPPDGATTPPTNSPAAGSATRPSSPAAHADGYSIAGTALGLRGSPYRNGGSDPSGFDCSGFVWYVFGQHGIRVGRTVGEQFREGKGVAPDTIEAGDLLFFATDGSGVSHVAMAIGGDEFVHAPSSRGEVRVERLSAPYWSSRYVAARRVLP